MNIRSTVLIAKGIPCRVCREEGRMEKEPASGDFVDRRLQAKQEQLARAKLSKA